LDFGFPILDLDRKLHPQSAIRNPKSKMRSFALLPAAGHSTRMGQPKLPMPIAGRPLILHTLAAWRRSRVDCVVVVIRPDDEPLAEVLRQANVEVVVPPRAPPDMKASLGYGLAHIADRYRPTTADAWLVAPADIPGLSPRIIDRLLDEAARSPGRVLIPTLAGRRGHPVLLSWPLAAQLSSLGENEGLSTLIDRHGPALVACDDVEPSSAEAFADIDTPADLRRYEAAFQTPCLPSRPPPPVH
jgi:molybdenum cofactor cytidylyltransferase